MDWQHHWNRVFTTRSEREVSWFEALPEVSIRLLESAGLRAESCVIDIGGGDSHLIDHLVARGLNCLAVLDVSGAALERARTRLGAQAAIPVWLEADVTGDWSSPPMDIWHDRAVFHFLTERHDRERYQAHLLETLKPGGSALVATFALDGPERCSGLPVVRYSAETLAAEMGPRLSLVEAVPHTHTTPWGSLQSFLYCHFKR